MACGFLVTCEHGGNRIPARYRPLFANHRELLRSHRGYDPGALAMARELAAALSAPLIVATTSRLLVDLNRSPGHPRLYSEATRNAPAAVRREIFDQHYLPYRRRAEAEINRLLERFPRLVHVSSHSFTPALKGHVRNADVGLLYDPARPGEVALCLAWQASLQRRAPGLRVRRNYPYNGRSDGLTAWLRQRHGPDAYVGIELEINQKQVRRGGEQWRALRRTVIDALADALAMN